MNTPYIKQYNQDGAIANPITKHNPYLNFEDNRETRRSKPKRFRGNNKGVSLSIFKNQKFYRIVQRVIDKETGYMKNINHYILAV